MLRFHDWIMRNPRGPRSSSPVPGRRGYEGELWLDHGNDSSGRSHREGIKYYPETDSFYVPRSKGGPYDVPAHEWRRHYGVGDFWEQRERQMIELRTTGRISGRETDRYGEPWRGHRSQGSHRGSESSK